MEQEVKILVVEDEEEIRDLIANFLEMNHYKVILANNGVEGLRRYKQHDKIDLVISDVDMPMMSGLEMGKELRKIGYTGLIIFGTASKVDNFQEPFLVLRKPYSYGLLLRQIKRYFT